MEKKQDNNVRTMVFDIPHEKEESMKATLRSVYNAMSEKGYNPINQIVGYLLSEDPTYITNHKGARSLMRKIDRDELLNELVKDYLGV
ncbi:MAG: IreB family regulatory phosphoprotein [Clostridia bacterium]|nr:IreB family regulatory phosphoprotein [Clostridia bacterium]